MSASFYLERYGFGKPLITTPPDSDLAMVVVIPCYSEPDLISTLQSLTECTPTLGKTEVIVIVNQSESANESVHQMNLQTINIYNDWVQSIRSDLSFYMFHQVLPDKKAGVGLARKIGMDEAVRRFQYLEKDGVIICLDADCNCQNNYLKALEEHFKDPEVSGCSIYFEHKLDSSMEPNTYRAIIDYELHLRYYVHGLKFAQLPAAFQTVGSCMAVRSSVYQQQGGMNTRQAGEDFYFLQKIIKSGGFSELITTTVYPSSRKSSRVPFGTGKAMTNYQTSDKETLLTYHPNTFKDLQIITQLVSHGYNASAGSIQSMWTSFSAGLKEFLPLLTLTRILQEMNQNTGTPASFNKRFFQWCDGFLAFKYANFVKTKFYPPIPVAEAAAWMLKEVYQIDLPPDESRHLLEVFRQLDRGEFK